MTDHDCLDFRDSLARTLEGLPVPPALTALSWHEHLLGCQDCRVLLEREEALELLLATLPEPRLPAELVARLVARLSALRVKPPAEPAGLDALLDLAAARAPEGLSERLRAGLRAERQLDALLDLAAPLTVPAGLSARVLRGLARDRRRVVPPLRVLRSMPIFAAAAGLVLAALGWALWSATIGDADARRDGQPTGEELASIAAVPVDDLTQAEPDPSLLAVLDVLENDCLWRDTAEGAEIADEGEDLQLLLADTLDSGDEILLAFLDE